jgi:hypothetical protein
MNNLSAALKKILNGLAMQYEADYLSDDDKKANLNRVLADIEREHKTNTPPKTTTSTPLSNTIALGAK